MVDVPKEAVDAVEKAAHGMGFAINTFMATILVEAAMKGIGLVPKFTEPEQQAMLVDHKVEALEAKFNLVVKSLSNIETYLRAVDPLIQSIREPKETDAIVHDPVGSVVSQPGGGEIEQQWER